ncbi:hypothetical protein PJKIFABJ_00178 [Pseudomonas phage PE09]|uniref:Uncharacterized protein n=2 Tax=Otagovirus TaxID=2560197 RepID=A0A7S7YDJ4_9CAUD|nr:hypothetical protein QGX22_gp076 [Pseudomonas phage PE09]YP_010768466.1 hypothetical protein QGX23_gp073 [Pseudomonas phage PN09]QHZ60114.1 hypothetical protein PJKIFABJ_00178 [Pseudomonas phage PE09]QPB10579.1 hypothetical protein PN09_158 [Pseudomonas phage PN09]
MAYKLKCRTCGHTYIAARDYYACPRAYCEANRPTVLEEVVNVAVDAALTYAAVDTTLDLLSGAGDVVDSIFNWD